MVAGGGGGGQRRGEVGGPLALHQLVEVVDKGGEILGKGVFLQKKKKEELQDFYSQRAEQVERKKEVDSTFEEVCMITSRVQSFRSFEIKNSSVCSKGTSEEET